MQISVIIPTYNEEQTIGKLLNYLQQIRTPNVVEIIVVDGQSNDDTQSEVAKQEGIFICSPQKGRAAQMNYAASLAKGNVLYFIHADTIPPESCFTDVQAAVRAGYPMGGFWSKFDSNRFLLKVNAYFTRFNKLWCRGGDQSLFITKAAFDALKGYKEEYCIMEEYELMIRARSIGYPFKIIPKPTLISARKYEGRSWLRVQIANFVVFNMFRLNYSPQAMRSMYSRLL